MSDKNYFFVSVINEYSNYHFPIRPIHIYAIRRWTFTRQDAIDHLLTATVLSIQTAALVIVLGPLAHGHKVKL